jgi:hypothetical protein
LQQESIGGDLNGYVESRQTHAWALFMPSVAPKPSPFLAVTEIVLSCIVFFRSFLEALLEG